MVPGVIVIGDDFPFSARNAKTGRDHTVAPTATFTWQLVDELTRDEIDTGGLTIYDEPTASFEGYVPAATTSDLTAGREYALRVRMTIAGKTTTRAAKLRAVYDVEDAGVDPVT